MNGIVVVKKEKKYTSFDVVARMRGIFGQKKIGHTGTLDPDAEGVLPVCLGNATKVCGMLTDTDKTYEAVLLLGRETDTQDVSGETLRESPVNVSEEEVRSAVSRFCGELLQTPPMYSALKVDGKKLCDLAREGKTVERSPRKITVYENEILSMQLPRVRLRIRCSKGTYIRTLCSDIGKELGSGGCMESLVRTRAAGFPLSQAVSLGRLEEAKEAGRLEEYVLPTETVFLTFPAYAVSEGAERLLENGNPLRKDELVRLETDPLRRDERFRLEADPLRGNEWVCQAGEPFLVRVYGRDGIFRAVYEYPDGEERCRPRKMFLQRG